MFNGKLFPPAYFEERQNLFFMRSYMGERDNNDTPG